jgi:hypothetical protein
LDQFLRNPIIHERADLCLIHLKNPFVPCDVPIAWSRQFR